MASYIPKASLFDPASFADSNGQIGTRVVGYHPSLLEDPAGFAKSKIDGVFGVPTNFTFGNALQMGTRALGPIGTLASGALGLFGIGTERTGNSILDQFATPSFGLGMSRGPKSEIYSDRGATSFSPEIYGAPAPSLFPQTVSDRPLAPRTAEIERASKSAVERALEQAYGSAAKRDNTGRWVAAPPTPSLFPSNVTPAQGGSSGSYSPWYAGQPDPFSATGNINNRVSPYDFGAGRYQDSPALAAYFGYTPEELDGINRGRSGWNPKITDTN